MIIFFLLICMLQGFFLITVCGYISAILFDGHSIIYLYYKGRKGVPVDGVLGVLRTTDPYWLRLHRSYITRQRWFCFLRRSVACQIYAQRLAASLAITTLRSWRRLRELAVDSATLALASMSGIMLQCHTLAQRFPTCESRPHVGSPTIFVGVTTGRQTLKNPCTISLSDNSLLSLFKVGLC